MGRKLLYILICILVPLSTSAQEKSVAGELPMGYVKSWTGQVIVNPEGGYNGKLNNVTSNIHGWENLYEAQAEDVYTITLPTAAHKAKNARVQFRTPIDLMASHKYYVRAVLKANRDVADVEFSLTEADDDTKLLSKATCNLKAGEAKTIALTNQTGTDIKSAKMEFALPTQEDSTSVSISLLKIYDQDERANLWEGTTYFNWMYYANPSTNKRIKDMQIEGRKETLSWTKAEYDDSQWLALPMPIGNVGYMKEVKTEWPGEENTNLWVRRNFIIDELDATAKYTLKVCHDDCYRTYVNGYLVDEASDWTEGKNPVSINIPIYYLRNGKNVIATYIQQNWGGRFYDCGMTVEPGFYEPSDLDADPTKLVINEVQVRNIDQYIDWSFNYGSWIEIYNPTDKRVSLTGLWLGTSETDACQFQLTQEAGVVPPHGWKTLYFNHYVSDGEYGPSASKQVRLKLSNDGGTVILSSHDKQLISTVTYPKPTARCSWARTSDGADEWGTTGEPTPGATNATSHYASNRLAAPEPDVSSRLFTDPFTMHVHIPEGYTLRYTIDGSTPTLKNGFTSRTGEFPISSTLVMRFAFFADGYLPSQVTTRSYLLRDKNYYLPVLSVSTKPDNLYDDSIGVYVDGVNGVSGRNHEKSNRNMDWERPVNVELISPDGTVLLNQEAEFKVSGGWSRHFMPASFKIKASKTYEDRKSLEASLFPNKRYNKYKQIIVRNGGNDNEDQHGGRLTDAITQQIIISSQYMVDAQDMQPAHVFFNGKYIGQMNLRETSNRYHGTANYGYSDDEMDAFEYSNGYVQTSGTRDAFNKWYRQSGNAADSAGYERLCELVDIDEYTNYWAAIGYIGPNDWIINQNNVKGYRSLPDGKFHLVLLDMDSGWKNGSTLTALEGNKSNELLIIYNNMKENALWRRKFVDAFCLLDGSVFTASRSTQIGDCICESLVEALSFEGRNPWNTYNKFRSSFTNEVLRKARINGLRKNYGLGEGMSVKFESNIPHASFRLNGQPVPTGRFDGHLFAPVSIEASAPAGYNFMGWRKAGANDKWLTTSRTLTLDKDESMQLEAIFAPVKDAALRDAGVHPVVINEVSAKNSVYQNDLYKREDWVELYNTTNEDIDLAGMYLSNTEANLCQSPITAAAAGDGTTIIPAHGYKVIWMDKAMGVNQLHASFKLPSADGSILLLTAADLSWTDTLRYDLHAGVESVGRYPDGGKRVYRMTRPTIAAPNWLASSSTWLYGEDINFDDSLYPTSISQPASATNSRIIRTEYYSLSGTRLAKPQKGVVIVNYVHEDGRVTTKKTVVN